MGGASGPKTFAHIMEFCDGWIPIYGSYPITENLDDMRRAAEVAERDPTTIELGVFAAPRDPALLSDLQRAGVSRAVFGVPPVDATTVMRKLDEYAALVNTL